MERLDLKVLFVAVGGSVFPQGVSYSGAQRHTTRPPAEPEYEEELAWLFESTSAFCLYWEVVHQISG